MSMYPGPNPKRTHTPNDTRSIGVATDELPVHCPLPSMSLWNSHPQVYIPLKKAGDEAICPYCSTRFRLDPGEGVTGNPAA
ncbi:MAG: zinc-finger domain-containing protein [Gammaproteobacteria bacterium]